jgi:integrase/recombinase XerD
MAKKHLPSVSQGRLLSEIRRLNDQLSVAATPARKTISVTEIEMRAQQWLMFCEIDSGVSPATLTNRRIYTEKLCWFAQRERFTEIGEAELRAFFEHIKNGHTEPDGRWGMGKVLANCRRPSKASTNNTYRRHMRTFFRWLVDEDALDVSPMEGRAMKYRKKAIGEAIDRDDQVKPFTVEQVTALRAAAKATTHPKRDEAIVCLLSDTGMRNTELISLRWGDLDLMERKITIQDGKGGKRRQVRLGDTANSALYEYIKEQIRQGRIKGEASTYLFVGDRGHTAGRPLLRNGLYQLIERLGRMANITNVRCSPHTFRHFYAVMCLRLGMQQMMLKELMGHESIEQTEKYVRFVQADVDGAAAEFSPLDGIRRSRNIYMFSPLDRTQFNSGKRKRGSLQLGMEV